MLSQLINAATCGNIITNQLSISVSPACRTRLQICAQYFRVCSNPIPRQGRGRSEQPPPSRFPFATARARRARAYASLPSVSHKGRYVLPAGSGDGGPAVPRGNRIYFLNAFALRTKNDVCY